MKTQTSWNNLNFMKSIKFITNLIECRPYNLDGDPIADDIILTIYLEPFIH